MGPLGLAGAMWQRHKGQFTKYRGGARGEIGGGARKLFGVSSGGGGGGG